MLHEESIWVRLFGVMGDTHVYISRPQNLKVEESGRCSIYRIYSYSRVRNLRQQQRVPTGTKYIRSGLSLNVPVCVRSEVSAFIKVGLLALLRTPASTPKRRYCISRLFLKALPWYYCTYRRRLGTGSYYYCRLFPPCVRPYLLWTIPTAGTLHVMCTVWRDLCAWGAENVPLGVVFTPGLPKASPYRPCRVPTVLFLR